MYTALRTKVLVPSNLVVQSREITETSGFKKVRLNHQRDNMHETPALAILPLDSTPDGVIDGNPSSSAATAKTGMVEVIILLSPAKSSHESPSGTGTDNSVALRQQRECQRLKKGRKP
jgi:hypothetical protein